MAKKTKEKKMEERPDTKGLIILDIVLGILTLLSVLVFGGIIVASVYSPENNRMMDGKYMMKDYDFDDMREEMLEMREDMEKYMFPKYDQNSWKTMINASCKSFFDGCNNCVRAEGGEEDLAACTRKFCPEYEMPRCMDDEVMEEGIGANPETSMPQVLPAN